jgi:hypothetical protein
MVSEMNTMINVTFPYAKKRLAVLRQEMAYVESRGSY